MDDKPTFGVFEKGVAGTVSLPIFSVFFRFLPFSSVFFPFFPCFLSVFSLFSFRFLPFFSVSFRFFRVLAVFFRFFRFIFRKKRGDTVRETPFAKPRYLAHCSSTGNSVAATPSKGQLEVEKYDCRPT